ncbi:hypothetical protein J3F84DRAFT_201933 [Trichoderma pleuroticola]
MIVQSSPASHLCFNCLESNERASSAGLEITRFVQFRASIRSFPAPPSQAPGARFRPTTAARLDEVPKGSRAPKTDAVCEGPFASCWLFVLTGDDEKIESWPSQSTKKTKRRVEKAASWTGDIEGQGCCDGLLAIGKGLLDHWTPQPGCDNDRTHLVLMREGNDIRVALVSFLRVFFPSLPTGWLLFTRSNAGPCGTSLRRLLIRRLAWNLALGLTRWLSLLSSLSVSLCLAAIGNTRYRSAPLFPPSRKQGFSQWQAI